MTADLVGLLESFGLADQFDVEQADADLLRCTRCGETVYAYNVDLHTCDTATPEPVTPEVSD